MNALDKIKAYLDCYGIKCKKEKEDFSCVYGIDRLIVDDKYMINCSGYWGQSSWIVREIGHYNNLVEQDEEYSAFDRRNCRTSKRNGYVREVIEFLNNVFDIKHSEHYYNFGGYTYKDLGKEKAEKEFDCISKRLDEKSVSVLDKNGYYYYYDEEYEGCPNKEQFLKMYEDSKIGWDSSEGLHIGMHKSSWNEGFEYVIECPDPKPIESKYGSWKDIAKKFRDMDIEELEGRIESVKEYYDDLIEDN